MIFPLIHTGRRFYYFTFVVEGRRQVLSRLVRGEKRPELTALGERVRAVWTGLHKMVPQFTASDAVIMPDHAHFLLMVNSDVEFRFNPLVFAHWFMEATSDGGVFPPIPPESWGAYYPVSQQVSSGSRQGVGGAGSFGSAPQGGGSRQGVGGAAPFVCSRFSWSRDFWVEISFDSRQLAAIRRYIRMNPARFFWKLDHPDMFVRRSRFRHPILDPALTWTACGDLTLLSSPFLFPVRLTMRKSPAELVGDINAHIERVERGGVPVCGFLSPGEREFERRLKAMPCSRWIKTVPYSLPERFDPSVEDSRFLAERRELILSSFTADEAPPFVIRRHLCLSMNERTAVLVRLSRK